MTVGVVVDIDDTLVGTDRRRWAVWNHVLDHKIPFQTVESLGSRQILDRFASANKTVWRRFWAVLLCWEEAGIELLRLDEPIPFAAEVLQKWSRESKLVYLTGRSENMRGLTLEELERFGFPVDDAALVMASREDYLKYFEEKYLFSVIKFRTRLFSSALKLCRVVRVVDDIPGHFTIYRRFGVHERIGFLRPKRFSKEDYLNRGATRVIESWKQLQD